MVYIDISSKLGSWRVCLRNCQYKTTWLYFQYARTHSWQFIFFSHILENSEQLQEKWRNYFPIIQAYCTLRDNRSDIPFATLLNEIKNNEMEGTNQASQWVKNATVGQLKLVQIDGSTSRKLCTFVEDEELFDTCPICMELLNTDHVAMCWSGCKVIYHKECLFRWINEEKPCPHCRRIIK